MPDQILVLPGSVDSHCHTGPMTRDGLPTTQLLSQVRELGMEAVIDVGIRPDDLEMRRKSLIGFDWVHFTSGIHPSEVNRTDRETLLDLLRTQAHGQQIVAVGEIGLDYHWDTGDRGAAIDLLDRQVALAVETDLPVIIHNREADEDILAVLARHRPPGVMHCFSQSPDFCRRCLDLGLSISFGGNLTYKRSDQIRESAAIVPDDRLLVETDAPYLSPVPVRGRPNHPGHLAFTLRALAELRTADGEELARVTAQNARALFRI